VCTSDQSVNFYACVLAIILVNFRPSLFTVSSDFAPSPSAPERTSIAAFPGAAEQADVPDAKTTAMDKITATLKFMWPAPLSNEHWAVGRVKSSSHSYWRPGFAVLLFTNEYARLSNMAAAAITVILTGFIRVSLGKDTARQLAPMDD
jgi:hypothetical protein